jgi:hypothetical protein
LLPLAAGIQAGLKLNVQGEKPFPGAFFNEIAGVAPFRNIVTSYVIEDTKGSSSRVKNDFTVAVKNNIFLANKTTVSTNFFI